LTGLVPAGLVGVTAATNVGAAGSTEASVLQHVPDDDQEALAAMSAALAEPVAAADFGANAMAKQGRVAPPVVKTVALPEGRQPAALTSGPLGVPGIAIAAYESAEHTLAVENPVCRGPRSPASAGSNPPMPSAKQTRTAIR
jgi:hypothetical protein